MSSPRSSRAKPFYDGRRYAPFESIGFMLKNLMLAMRKEVESRMAQHGLTDAQWRPLWCLHSGEARTAIEMARDMCVDAGALTRTLDRLEAKGLVERVRSEEDRRVVHLRLTAAGTAAAAEIPRVLAAVNNDFLKGFDEREWQQLRDLIARMLANGDALQEAQQQEAA